MRRLTSLALAIGLGVGVAAALAPRAGAQATAGVPGAGGASGVRYAFRTTTRTASPIVGDMTTFIAGRVRARGGTVRIDFDSMTVADPLIGPGTFLVIRAGSTLMQMVDPAKKRYIEVDIDSLSEAAAGMGAAIGLEFSPPTIAAESLGAGEPLLGRETRRYRLTSEFTATANAMGQALRAENRAVNEVWAAPSLTGVADAGEILARVFGRGAGAVGSALVDTLAAARARLTSGLALRTVSTNTLTMMGNRTEVVSTNEITDLRQEPIDESAFRMPAGFRKADLAEVLGAMPEAGPPATRPPAR